MMRTLLATTAVAMFMATGALAQSTTQPPAATTPPAATGQNDTGTPAKAPLPADAAEMQDGHLASDLIGQSVYDSTAPEAKNIGKVNDIVIGAGGQVASIVVGVGGFLGIGEKNVAIDYANLDWQQRDGAWWLVVPTSADELKALPDFDRSAFRPTAMSDATPSATLPSSDGTAATPPDEGTKTGAIDRSTLDPVDVGQLNATDFIGTTVYGADEAKVGEINDIVLGGDGKVDAVVLDVGGFLGVGSKPVAIGMDNLAFLADQSGKKYLYTEFTKEQLEAQPAYDKATYAQNRDTMRLRVQ